MFGSLFSVQALIILPKACIHGETENQTILVAKPTKGDLNSMALFNFIIKEWVSQISWRILKSVLHKQYFC